MSKSNPVTLHQIIRVYNDMFNFMDGVMRGMAINKTKLKKEMFFAMMLAQQKVSIYYAILPPTMVMILTSAHSLNPFQKLQLFRKWHKGMDINPVNETPYTT